MEVIKRLILHSANRSSEYFQKSSLPSMYSTKEVSRMCGGGAVYDGVIRAPHLGFRNPLRTLKEEEERIYNKARA